MQTSKFDYIVIGSGIAGLTFALKAAAYGSVAIITKKEMMETNTTYAQGGIAGVLAKYDSFSKHIEDTLKAGDGLCDPEVVELVVTQGPELIGELMQFGVQFTQKNGKLDLGREGGHSVNRIVHAADTTGYEILRVMVEMAKNHPNISIFEHHFAVELITSQAASQKGRKSCLGVYVLDQKASQMRCMLGKVTVLASGGAGEVYQHTTNPAIATGDGIAMAHRAGAAVKHMEFVQFHPTSLYMKEANSFLISEALRGFGGILRNAAGKAFMAEYDARRELAPRDIVARAIDHQLKKNGDSCVFLDVRHMDAVSIQNEFPNIYETCLRFGIDITTDLIPVVPAMHYTCGGVVTDLDGRTNINHLLACGEAACTGLHGANRLASNSLLESLVFAHQAAKQAVREADTLDYPNWNGRWELNGKPLNSQEEKYISRNRQELKRVMWEYVGIVRNNARLEAALKHVELLRSEIDAMYSGTSTNVSLCELRNLTDVAHLIILCALQRKESRGLHYNTDYPRKPEFAVT